MIKLFGLLRLFQRYSGAAKKTGGACGMRLHSPRFTRSRSCAIVRDEIDAAVRDAIQAFGNAIDRFAFIGDKALLDFGLSGGHDRENFYVMRVPESIDGSKRTDSALSSLRPDFSVFAQGDSRKSYRQRIGLYAFIITEKDRTKRGSP